MLGLKNVWDLIYWDKHKLTVSRIQARIVKALKTGLKQTARGLQRLLPNSFSAKLIAIKRVISNSGKRTPGVDNILIDTPRKRWETLKNLNFPEYKAKPLRRKGSADWILEADIKPYDPLWKDYLNARWKRKQLSGVATRLINA